MGLVENILGDYTRRNKKRIKNLVSKVNDLSEARRGLKDKSDFLACTNEFRERLRNGETIDDIKVEALSVVREAIRRVLGMYPFDVQIEASLAMSESVIAEMKTGEGKTLVQMLVAYLNLLEATMDEDSSKWKGVHIMTANDALAKRDADQNRGVFELLGFTCGFVPSRKSTAGYTNEQLFEYKKNKKNAYSCDVTYASATTIAFDYLDDNCIYRERDLNINKEFGYAIIDEADDLLIDKAINPLLINGEIDGIDPEYSKNLQSMNAFNLYAYKWATEFLYENDLSYKVYDQYEKDKDHVIESSINDKKYVDKIGVNYVYYLDTREVFLSEETINYLYSGLDNLEYRDYVYNMRYTALVDCIIARHTFIKGKQYSVDVNDGIGRVILIDQNTGRRKTSSKYRNGIQEAIEAKEDFFANDYEIEKTNPKITKAKCTYPDFLSLYTGRVSGMTGTSDIEGFEKLYNMQTYEVESRKPNIRVDLDDRIYATSKEKYNAIINEIVRVHETGEPILIGTTNDRESEIVSSMLKEKNIPHMVLRSDREEQENEIIATAGEKGMVTVSTNMAGRGTDIKLGPKVSELGGLYVIGTSKNNSERVDYQLRGRAGRQGDPGKSVFYCSLEDELVRLYYPQISLDNIIKKYIGSNEAIEDRYVKNIAKIAQKYKEGLDALTRRVFEERNKVFTEHKKTMYAFRTSILKGTPRELAEKTIDIIVNYVSTIVEHEDYETIKHLLGHLINVDEYYDSNKKQFCDKLCRTLCKVIDAPRRDLEGINRYKYIENIRTKMLRLIDIYWIDHMEGLIKLEETYSDTSRYELEANKEFSLRLMPALFNEIITYHAYPDMELGTYQIDYGPDKNDQLKIMV